MFKKYIFGLVFGALFALGVNAAEVIKKQQLVMAVSEGTSGGITADIAIAKYQPLADLLGSAINAEIKVVFVRNFIRLANGMKNNEYDLVLARPSDYPARGIRDNAYKFVSTTSPDGQCVLIVHKDSPIMKVEDLKGKRFVFPEEAAYMTHFCQAELREKGILIEREKVYYVHEQAAIPMAIENKICDVGGVASYSGAYKKWLKSGHRVLYKSSTQPYMPMVASRKLTIEQVNKLQGALTGVGNTEFGKKILERIGINGFVTTEEVRLRKLLEWLNVDSPA
jgi:ABC-type phosphate/phosphonate transport system substrate-binding protein